MTLDEAIKIKTLYVEHLPPGVNENWICADNLSIEALKRIMEDRLLALPLPIDLLPGETTE